MRVALLLLLSFVALPPAVAAGEVFKCRMADGSLAFLDHACPETAKELATPKLAGAGSKGATLGVEGVLWGCDQEAASSSSPGNEADYRRMPVAQQEMFGLTMSGVALGAGRASRPAFFDSAGAVHVCEILPDGKESELVVTADGKAYGRKDGKVEFFGGPSPVMRLRRCHDLLLDCPRGADRDFDRCVAQSACATSEQVPGEAPCCPQACVARFREQRLKGLGEYDAMDRAFSDESCTGPMPRPSRAR